MTKVQNSVIVQDPDIHSGERFSAARASLFRHCSTIWRAVKHSTNFWNNTPVFHAKML